MLQRSEKWPVTLHNFVQLASSMSILRISFQFGNDSGRPTHCDYYIRVVCLLSNKQVLCVLPV